MESKHTSCPCYVSFKKPIVWDHQGDRVTRFPVPCSSHGIRTCRDQLGICCHRLRSINSWMEMPWCRVYVKKTPWPLDEDKKKVESIDSLMQMCFYIQQPPLKLKSFWRNHLFKLPFWGYRLEAWWKKNGTRSMNETTDSGMFPVYVIRIEIQSKDYVWWYLNNTFTYHCFSCDVKPNRVSEREQ